MAWTDPSDIFCAQEDFERRVGLAIEGTSASEYAPSKQQAEDFATATAAAITLRTAQAGTRYEPPASSITDTALRSEIVEANAAGAAYEYLKVLYLKSGGPKVLEARNLAREDWLRYIGNRHLGGTDNGSIFEAVVQGSGVLSSFTDADSGETTLQDAPTADAEPPFHQNNPSKDLDVNWP